MRKSRIVYNEIWAGQAVRVFRNVARIEPSQGLLTRAESDRVPLFSSTFNWVATAIITVSARETHFQIWRD